MNKLKIAAGEWVVVCDGRKALVLENGGDEKFPNLQTRWVREHQDAPTSAQGTDEPGRVQQSVGTQRSAVEQTDWHDQAERGFLRELAGHLDAALRDGQTRSIILVAPPRALGMIRPLYSPALREAIRAEVSKDLVKTPVHEIERHISG